MLSPLQALAALLSLLVIGYDVYARRVPNALLLGALLLGGCWLLWSVTPATAEMPPRALFGLSIGLLSMLPFYAMGWMGAGDVKFFAVLGFLLGWRSLFPIWMIGSLVCGVHALALLGIRAAQRSQPQLAILQSRLDRFPLIQRTHIARQGRHGLPFAAYLSVGVLLVLSGTVP